MNNPEMTSKDFAENVWEYLIKFSIKRSHRLTESDKYRLSFEKLDVYPPGRFEVTIKYSGQNVADVVYSDFSKTWRIIYSDGTGRYESQSPVTISEQIVITLERICQNAS